MPYVFRILLFPMYRIKEMTVDFSYNLHFKLYNGF